MPRTKKKKNQVTGAINNSYLAIGFFYHFFLRKKKLFFFSCTFYLRSRWWQPQRGQGRCRRAPGSWSAWRTGTWAPSCRSRAGGGFWGTPGWRTPCRGSPTHRLCSCTRPGGWTGLRRPHTSAGSPGFIRSYGGMGSRSGILLSSLFLTLNRGSSIAWIFFSSPLRLPIGCAKKNRK